MKKRLTFLILTMLISSSLFAQGKFYPGQEWLDNNGVAINAHGGGVLYHEGTYYWYGEHKIKGKKGNTAMVGVHCYSSTNLTDWTDEGVALAVSNEKGHDIEKGCILERPKVIYNPKTDKFVMWFHLELKSEWYASARFGVATSDSPTGPFDFLYSGRANAGAWPLNITEEEKIDNSAQYGSSVFTGGESEGAKKVHIVARDFEKGQMARDMTLFVDDDGSAYCIYSAEENSTLHISLLDETFTKHIGHYVRIRPFEWNEAPAVFKRDGKYYLLASGCTGWSPNAARSFQADSLFGEWKEMGSPLKGRNPITRMDETKTYGGQSTFVLKVEGKDTWIAMFDVWYPRNPIKGRYIWLPVEFTDEHFKITWQDEWSLP